MFLENYVSFCEADACAIYVEGGLAAVLVIALAIYICFDKVAEALIWNLYLKKFEIGCFALTMPVPRNTGCGACLSMHVKPVRWGVGRN